MKKRRTSAKATAHAAHQVASAEAACRARGLQLTTSRKAVLEILSAATRPLGAYDVLKLLSDASGREVAPPTVYRALDFLVAQRFISKLESKNTFVPCAHPEHPHACVFFICENCGASIEVENPKLEKLIIGDAAAIGFRVNRRIVELQGACSACVAAAQGA